MEKCIHWNVCTKASFPYFQFCICDLNPRRYINIFPWGDQLTNYNTKQCLGENFPCKLLSLCMYEHMCMYMCTWMSMCAWEFVFMSVKQGSSNYLSLSSPVRTQQLQLSLNPPSTLPSQIFKPPLSTFLLTPPCSISYVLLSREWIYVSPTTG